MYLVIELQKVSEEQVANIVTAYQNRNVAESKYHDILSAASVSALPCHSATLLDDKGRMIKSEFYEHGVMQNE